MKKVLFILLMVLFSQSNYATDTENPLSKNLVNELFSTLPGTWDGRAIETPVGPVDYEINVHQCGESVIAGVANTGASLHYWRFWKSNDELRLTFLSTFRGNQDPTQLVSSKFEDKTIWFYAPELALLTVSVTLDEPNIHFRVFHHDKPHVYIRLTRVDRVMTESEHEDSKEKSCRNL